MLNINGMDVPVAAANPPDGGADLIGETGRFDSGAAWAQVRAEKERWRISTPPLSLERAHTIYHLLRPTNAAAGNTGRGDTWAFTDLYSGRGLGPSSGYVATLRPGEGKYADAVAVEEASTNLLPSNAHTFATGWSAFLGAVVSVSQSEPLSPYTSAAASRIQSAGGSSELKYFYSFGTGTAGTPFSVSLYIRNAYSAPMTVFTGFDAAVVPSGTTTRVEISTAAVNGATGRQLAFYTAAAGDPLDIYVWRPMAEVNEICTSYAETTRAAGILPYAVGTPWAEFTAAGWFRAGANAGNRALMGSYPDWWVRTDGAANNALAILTAGATMTTGAISGLGINAGLSHVALTYHAGTGLFRLYTGGVLRYTSSATTVSQAGIFGFGTPGGGLQTEFLNGIVSDAVLLPFEADANLIAALAARTRAIPALPRLEASGDLFRDRRVTVRAENVRLRTVPPTYRVVEFDLVEAA